MVGQCGAEPRAGVGVGLGGDSGGRVEEEVTREVHQMDAVREGGSLDGLGTTDRTVRIAGEGEEGVDLVEGLVEDGLEDLDRVRFGPAAEGGEGGGDNGGAWGQVRGVGAEIGGVGGGGGVELDGDEGGGANKGEGESK